MYGYALAFLVTVRLPQPLHPQAKMEQTQGDTEEEKSRERREEKRERKKERQVKPAVNSWWPYDSLVTACCTQLSQYSLLFWSTPAVKLLTSLFLPIFSSLSLSLSPSVIRKGRVRVNTWRSKGNQMVALTHFSLTSIVSAWAWSVVCNDIQKATATSQLAREREKEIETGRTGELSSLSLSHTQNQVTTEIE